MRYTFTILFFGLFLHFVNAQSTYTQNKYAVVGDTERLTIATIDSTDYYSTGANYTWKFDSLKGVSQDTLTFRDPKNAGFTQSQWAYLFNSSNVNLSSTNQQTNTIGPATVTNQNDFYQSNAGGLVQKASSFTLTSGISLNIKNTFTTVDSIYRFPLNYNDTFSSAAGFTTSVAFIYYNKETLKRATKVDGWGTLITPYGTFKNCLRLTSNVIRYDSFAVTGYKIPVVNQNYRELKWIDTSKGYPVLTVTQTNTGNGYTTTGVEYLDVKKVYPPMASFVYRPLNPSPSDTISFYNTSLNSKTYSWNFGDSTTSTTANPTHIYTNAGVYTVTLIALANGISDTFTTQITVGFKPTALFTYTPATPKTTDTIFFKNRSLKATGYYWNFGDLDTSTATSPYHIYSKAGTYSVTLIAFNTKGGYDTFVVKIIVAPTLPIKLISFIGSKIGNLTTLKWYTAQGSNEASFVVERSCNGINFTNLASIASNTQNYYEYTDANCGNCICYYRLKMIDQQNKISYSSTIKISTPSIVENKLIVSPNPITSKESIKLQFKSTQNNSINIQIVGIDGKTVLNKKVEIVGGNNIISLQNNLMRGIYILNLIEGGRKIVATSKLVIN